MNIIMGQLTLANRRHRAKSIILAVMILFSITSLCSAQSKEKITTEEILEILKDKGIVSEEQYNKLMEKAEAEKKKIEKDYTVRWSNGINVNRNDGAFKAKFGGRLHFDWGLLDPDSSLERNEANGVYGSDALKGDGVEFRRARLYISGTLWEDYLFKAQYDFAGGGADFKDAFLGMQNIPAVGTILVGQILEPFSLEELTSSNYITFMERALPNAFAPSRKSGIRASNEFLDKRMTYGLGFFYGDTDNDGDSNFDDITNIDFTLRLTGLLYYENKGQNLLHLGLGYSHQFRDEGKTTVRYRNRPESHLTDALLVDTGNINTDSADLLNPEVALVWGPISFQGEYFWTKLDSSAANDPAFQGAYAYGSWFITGENRPYSTSSGVFGRVKPNKNFHPTGKGGPGAWEIGVRWSWLDLNDEQIRGGEEDNITVGVNWYLNPNYRILFNFVFADAEDRSDAKDGKANILQTRFQMDF